MERFVITTNIKRLRKMLWPVGKLDNERERQIRQVLAEEEAKLSELDQKEAAPPSGSRHRRVHQPRRPW
jgi:hypothetical protein